MERPAASRSRPRPVWRTFLRGLAVLLPAAVTVYILYWVAVTAEATLGGAIRRAVPEGYYVRGLGIALGCLFVFGVGVLTNVWLAQRFLMLFEEAILRVPVIKTIYGSVKDLTGFVAGEGKRDLRQVVFVRFETPPVRMLGFVTREDLAPVLPNATSDSIAVYLPMSYQIGGFTVVVSRDRVTPANMTVEEGMRFAMTAGISSEAGTPGARAS